MTQLAIIQWLRNNHCCRADIYYYNEKIRHKVLAYYYYLLFIIARPTFFFFAMNVDKFGVNDKISTWFILPYFFENSY